MQEAYDKLSTPEERDKVDNPENYEAEPFDFGFDYDDDDEYDDFFGDEKVSMEFFSTVQSNIVIYGRTFQSSFCPDTRLTNTIS